jgi:hypothetical protein
VAKEEQVAGNLAISVRVKLANQNISVFREFQGIARVKYRDLEAARIAALHFFVKHHPISF